MVYWKRFKEVIDNKYKGWKDIYTDGSISEIGVRAGEIAGNCTDSASIPKFSFFFQNRNRCNTPSSE